MIKYFLLVAVLLSGCGNHTKIEFHETSRADIVSRSGFADNIAWTDWQDYGYKVECDIYLLPILDYKTSDCYNAIVIHERRHCYEFDFHAEPAYISECKGVL